MDTVSRLLRLARVDARLDKRCLLAPSTGMSVAPGSALEAPFHLLLEGSCQLDVGGQALNLSPGDMVVIPSGKPHRITTLGPGRQRGTSETVGAVFTTTRSQGLDDPVIDLFCGYYRFGSGAGAMLLHSLPEVVHVSFGHSAEMDEALRMLSALMRNEAQHEGEGTAAILSALSAALLAMVLRTSSSINTETVLWTAASDGDVAAIIEAVLNNPAGDWSIARLSREAGMSRATFLRRFSQSTGMTVGTFLTRARLMSAAELLETSGATVASIAGQVGYQSESAFTRAFRAEAGTTPARFRRAISAGRGSI